ncbi:ribonuclease T2 [Leptodactylus fuscus]|uniref:ribonuclease T2 n=1 Tax=Leptodactylus fuscus TaxID=238119 RepID=UPI003F4EBC26
MEFRVALVFASVLLGCLHVCCTDSLWGLRKHSEWNKLILVHQWPVTVCKTVGKSCTDLPDYWTLHGLWPDKSEMCNSSWPLDLSNIQDLLPELNKWWPNILHPNCSDFWKHEWIKHGTCAASLSCLDSQHKYFAKGLELYAKLGLNSVLQKFGITPDNTYTLQTIRDVFSSAFGVVAKIQCIPPEQGSQAQILGQLELCFTKDFQMEDCTHGEELRASYVPLHVCDETLDIYYPPV